MSHSHEHPSYVAEVAAHGRVVALIDQLTGVAHHDEEQSSGSLVEADEALDGATLALDAEVVIADCEPDLGTGPRARVQRGQSTQDVALAHLALQDGSEPLMLVAP
jgi:hypothetical protein